ncbi:hypothetical protein O181_127821 [Austropuccinia psidii MF-1]|uniref:Uncharacterized protein n=1 Tax=Austropuccinia psidii MF-1 TaxID=1389203 RepID=A0A9Q3KWY3_9BASI|nr:hypothetical protein [Austropuccinia psidii MF-1]
MEGAAQSRKEGRGPRRSNSLSGVAGGFPGTSRTILKGPGTGGVTLAQSDQPVSHQSEPSLLAIMQQMTQIMTNLQAATSSESSSPTAFKNPSMKAPEFLMGLSPSKSEASFSLAS